MAEEQVTPATQFKAEPYERLDTPFVPYDASPSIPQDDLDAAAKKAKAARPTWGEGWDAAQHEGSSLIASMRHLDAAAEPVDFAYRLPQGKDWDSAVNGIPQDRLEELTDATSAAAFERIRQNILESEEDGQRLSELGVGKSLMLRLGTAATDPGAIALGAATYQFAGAGYFAQTGVRLSRLQRVMRVGSIAAAENAALERYLETSYNQSDWQGPAMAALFGFGLGGALGALGRVENATLSQVVRDATRKVEEEAAQEVPGFGAKSAGSAEVGGTGIRALAPGPQMGDEPIPYTAMGSVRFDSVGTLKSIDEPSVRQGASALAEDAVGNADHSASPIPASTRSRMFQNVRESQFYREAKPAFQEWIKETELPNWQRLLPETRERFFKEVSDHIESGGGSASAARAAAALNDSFKKTLEFAKQSGLAGAADVAHSNSYLPHMWSVVRARDFYMKYGNSVEELFAKSFREANEHLEPARAAKLGRWVLTKLRRVNSGMDIDFNAGFNREKVDLLRTELRDWTDPSTGSRLGDDEIESMLTALAPSESKGATSRLRSRMIMDTETTMSVRNKQTGEMEVVRIKDLMERNAERLHSIYTRQLSGRAALARSGWKSQAEWDTWKGKVMAEMEANASVSDRQRTIAGKNLDYLWKSVAGIPLNDDPLSLGSRAGRVIRDYNFVRMMNQMGLAQAVETANLLSLGGVRNVMMHIWEVPAMLKRLKNGDLKDELSNELEVTIGQASEVLREAISNHADGLDAEIAVGRGLPGATNQFLDKAENVLHPAKKVTNVISGFYLINTVLHRMAGKAVAQKFMNMALDAEAPNMNRLAAVGISEDMLPRILQQMKTHAQLEDSALGGGRKLRKMNIDKWKDDEAKDVFTHAMFSMGRRIIQENDVGNQHRWMSTELGKILFQFRNFISVAWGKQNLHNVHMRDTETALMFSFSTMSGMLMYSMRTYINSIGREDQQAYLDKRLRPEQIVKSGWAQSAWASIIPTVVDTAALAGGKDKPIFGYSRTSGLSSGILGNPTIDLMTSIVPGVTGAAWSALLPQQQVSQDQGRAIANALFWSNAVGIRNFLQQTTADLPKRSKPAWMTRDENN